MIYSLKEKIVELSTQVSIPLPMKKENKKIDLVSIHREDKT